MDTSPRSSPYSDNSLLFGKQLSITPEQHASDLEAIKMSLKDNLVFRFLLVELQVLHDVIFTLDLLAVNWNIQKEVAQYERKYRGKELPGFINYKTFEAMVKEQIKELEEPAIIKLKEVTGMMFVMLQ